MTTTLELITFPGPGMLPVWIAEEMGFFGDPALQVNVTPTPGSAYQIQHTVAGDFQIASTAIDNVVAYQEDQGVIELDREPDLFVFMGNRKHIVLDLMVAPEINSYEDLRGKSFALDALTTGYAFVLRHMLESHGLPPGSYDMVPVGGTGERLGSLIKGEHVAALLNPPFTTRALEAGLKTLDTGGDAIANYQGNTLAASRAWAAANRPVLVEFIRGFLRGLQYLNTPDNRTDCVEILVKNTKNLTPDAAGGQIKGLLGKNGFSDNASLDMDGVKTVLELRSAYGEPKKELTNPMKYIDMSYYNEALATL
jgi:ABC-type nitrate/sulfonate/bicarbonate transport system substrate-binding protein